MNKPTEGRWDAAIAELAEKCFDPGNISEVRDALRERLVPTLEAARKVTWGGKKADKAELKERMIEWLKI